MAKSTNPHTKAAANRSVYKRRFGSQWIVVNWDRDKQIWRESHPMDYWQACRSIRIHKDGVIAGDIDGYLL